MKDHEIAALVNNLRDIALSHHASGQLRERIAHVIVPLLKAPSAPVAPDERAAFEAHMSDGGKSPRADPSATYERLTREQREYERRIKEWKYWSVAAGICTPEQFDATRASLACPLPPAGWRCTRRAGHDGPCAAYPAAAPTPPTTGEA